MSFMTKGDRESCGLTEIARYVYSTVSIDDNAN